jgi:ribosomal protein S18 acetylase RimI-like enzyme
VLLVTPPAKAAGHGGRVHVRTATHDDLPVVITLWAQLRDGAGRSGGQSEDPTERFAAILDDPAIRIVVATFDDVVEGMAILSTTTLGPLSTTSAVHIAHVVVEGGTRRRGVGRALVAAAAAYAEEIGAEHVTVSVYPGLREANRFYARLGFSPFVVRRLATVATLQRKLATAEHPVAVTEELTRRRIVAPRLRPVRRRGAITVSRVLDRSED